jgi:hypothetical protein
MEWISNDSGLSPLVCFYENGYEMEMETEILDQLRNIKKKLAPWSKNFIYEKVRR